MVKRYRQLIFLFVLPALIVRAGVTLELSRNTISADDTVDLILKTDEKGNPGIPSIPLPEELKIIGTSRQERIINFNRESSVRYTLKADKAGTYKIGPFQLKGKTGDETVPALTLTVTEAKVIQSTENLFVTLESGADELLVQETVELLLTLYSRVPIGDINIQDFENEGFEVSQWQQVRGRQTQVGQRVYNTHRFVAQLTPTRPGTLRLDPSFRVEVSDRDEPFGRLFGPRSVRVLRLKLKEPLILKVSSPPETGRPENYAGHLGNFRLDATVSPKVVKVGDPVTLRVELSGTGSLQQALPPGLKESEDFKVYQPKLVTEDLERGGLSGRKIIEQVVIPKKAGISEIPALSFSYYDTSSRSYKTLDAGPFPLTVLADNTGETPSTVSSLPDDNRITEPELLGEDILYLKTRPGNIQPWQSLEPGWEFVGFSSLPFALWALVGVILRRKESREHDIEGRKRQEAPRRLRKQLQKLENSKKEIYPLIWEVLSDYLSARLNLPPGELSTQDVLSRLPDSFSEDLSTQLTEWMQACERARFSGTDRSEETTRIREEFRSFILNVDKELR